MSLTQFEVGKEYQTRDGRRVRIYATDAGGDYPIHAAVWGNDRWHAPDSWLADGGHSRTRQSDLDLMPPEPEIVVSDAVAEAFAVGVLTAAPDATSKEYHRTGLAAAIRQYLRENPRCAP